MTLPTPEQGVARLVIPASVKSQGMLDTEGVATAQSETTEEATPTSLPAVGPLTENDAAVLEVKQIQSPTQQVLQGRLEKSNGTKIEGWAWDSRTPDRQIRLELMEGDKCLSVIVANTYRSDLVQLGCGDGRHGFHIELEEGLISEGSHVLTLRCADTGATLPGSPIVAEHRMPVATSYPTTSPLVMSEIGLIIRGQIDKVTDAGIFGWVMIADRPLHKCTVLLKERGYTVAQAIASQFRVDLLSAGIVDGCCAFVFEPPWPLGEGQEHMLDIVEEQTGAKLNKEPIRWLPEMAAVHTAIARPSGTPDNRFLSTLRKLDASDRIRHAISRSDYARYRHMGRFATGGVTASVLSVTDALRETGTLASRFLTDSMIAAWLLRKDLQQQFQQLDEEPCQYALLVWFLCVRPLEEGLVLSWEPTGPILMAMAKAVVVEDAKVGAGCSALMLAAYCYVARYQGSGMLSPLQCQLKDIVKWFCCEGAYHLRVSYAILQDFRADLAAYRSNGVSTILEWAEQRIPSVNVADLTEMSRSQRILARLAHSYPQPIAANWQDLLRESLIVEDQVQLDDPPDPILPAVCKRLRDALQDMSELLLIDGQPEYMCAGGNGERLLLKSEWYPLESAFVWSRAPISTVLFCIAGGAVDWLRIGLMFDQSPLPERGMKVMLNHNTLWSGTIGDASSGELILACTGRCLAHDAPNLLQIEVDRAFVPSELLPSSDNRTLGIGLKRIWIQRGEGLSK